MKPWTIEVENKYLDCVLTAEDEEDMVRKIRSFFDEYGTSEAYFWDSGIRWIRRRINKRSLYSDTTGRLSRAGLPWTWAEELFLHWAKKKGEGEIPTVDYVALLLQRTEEEINQHIKERDSYTAGFRHLF